MKTDTRVFLCLWLTLSCAGVLFLDYKFPSVPMSVPESIAFSLMVAMFVLPVFGVWRLAKWIVR